jgi:hypothetical protein
MDEGIRMTVVINPVITPLLFDALKNVPSARTRALLLKTLAENALRYQEAGNTQTRDEASSIASTRRMPEPDEGLQLIRVDDSSAIGHGVESESIRDQFASFF